MEYSQAYIGTCIDDEDKYNLKKGTQYLLKDKTGKGENYHVYQIIVNRFYGCYPAKHFQIDKEVTPDEVEEMMEHPVNYWGLDSTGNVRETNELGGSISSGVNIPEIVIEPERPKEKPVSEPAKAAKPSKPVQRGLFG